MRLKRYHIPWVNFRKKRMGVGGNKRGAVNAIHLPIALSTYEDRSGELDAVSNSL